MKVILLTICTLLLGGYTWGQNTMPSDAIDLTGGSLFIKSDSYAIGATGNTTTTHAGDYNIYTSASTANTITAETGPQILNLWNVNYSTTSGSFISNSLAYNLTVNCNGDNYLTNSSTASTSFINFKTNSAAALTLSGDKLTTSNYDKPFCSGTGYNVSIILNINYLNITCAKSTLGYAFGVTASTKIPSLSVSDNVVLTLNNANMPPVSGSITVGKASIKLNGGSFKTTPVNSNSDALYCVTVPRNGTHTITVKNNTTSTSEDYTFTYEHPNDDNYYLWLPNGSYTLTSNGTDYNAVVNSAAVTASVAPKAGDGNIDVSAGNVSIYDGGYQIGIQPYTYAYKVYTLSGTTTTNTVSITAGADTVKLNGVDIEPSAGCAININTGKDIAVVLNESTTNTLKSYTGAGLQKSQTDGMLTIKGKGTLIASSSAGPGIGSAFSACSNITIEEGIIIASTSTLTTAAIGTVNYNCSNIFIKGGSITATTYSSAYAIGASASQTISNIQISGGKVYLYSGNKLNANNYLLPPNTTVTGGTITGRITEGITGSLMSSSSVITGGSVNFVDVNGAFSLAAASHPTNGVTTDYLYRSLFLVPGITTATAISAISIDGNAWGCTDVVTNDTGMVYLWLPKDDASAYETTTVTITVGDKTYTYVGQIDAIDNIVEATSSVSAQGNLFYLVPISITENNASLTVKDYDGNAYSDGSLICSGQLDDNKPRLTISAIANTGYTDASFTYTNLEAGSKYYKVIAGSDDTVKIVSSATPETPTIVEKTEADVVTAYVSGNNIIIKATTGTSVDIYTLTGQKVITDITSNTTETYRINNTGIYIVKLSNSEGCKTIKCVVK